MGATERQPTGQLFSCRAAPGGVSHAVQRTTQEPDPLTLQQPVLAQGSCDDSFWSDGDVADERHLTTSQDPPKSHSKESANTSRSSQPAAPHATPQDSKQVSEEEDKVATAEPKDPEWDQHIVVEKVTADREELMKLREAKRRHHRHAVTHATAFRLRSDAERWASARIAEWRLVRVQRQQLVTAMAAWRALCVNDDPSNRNSSWL